MTTAEQQNNPFAQQQQNNPFQTNVAAPAQAPTTASPFGAQPQPAPVQQPQAASPVQQQAPQQQQWNPQPVQQAAPPVQQFAAPGQDTPAGDPFSDPTGGGSGDKMAQFLGMLMLVKPVEFIPEFKTTNGPADTVRVDLAILDGAQAGYISIGCLVFQKALVRDLTSHMKSTVPYLLTRLVMGEARNGNNAPYLFQKATNADNILGRQFLAHLKAMDQTL